MILTGQSLQGRRLGRGQTARAWLRVDDAERADGDALWGFEASASVEPEERLARHQGVVAGARIDREIGDDQHPRPLQGVPAHGLFQRRLARIEADAGLEPLPVTRDEADQGHRSVADLAGQQDDVVETGLGRGVEDVIAVESLETLSVVE